MDPETNQTDPNLVPRDNTEKESSLNQFQDSINDELTGGDELTGDDD